MSPEEINNIAGESNDVVSFNLKDFERREDETSEEYIDRLTEMYDEEYGFDKVEYIPGTNVKKPRNRELYESDEEYSNYLENYYNEHADEFKNEDTSVDTDTVEEFVESDEKEDSKDNNTVKIEEEIIANPIKTTIEEELIVNSSSNDAEKENLDSKDDNTVKIEAMKMKILIVKKLILLS